MDQLTQSFTSEQNKSFIIGNTIEQVRVYADKTIENNEDLFNAFNTVATAVFNAERKSGKSLGTINGIVINQLVKYIIKNINQFIEKQQPKEITEQQPKQKLVTSNVQLTQLETPILLKDIEEIIIKSVDICNSDYTINENNNVLVLRALLSGVPDKELYDSPITIELEPGYYNTTTIVDHLNSFNRNFHFCVNKLTNKVSITHDQEHNFEILEESTMGSILGEFRYNEFAELHTSLYPMKLFKQRYLWMSISMDQTIIFDKNLILPENDKYMSINVSENVNIRKGLSCSNIGIDLHGYNTRNFPFLIEMSVKHLDL